MARVDKDHIDKFFEYGVDVQGRTIWLGSYDYDENGGGSGVDHVMAERLIKAIYLLDRAAPTGDKPIKILLNTPGGDTYQGMAMYDAIKACNNHVVMIGMGEVCSMGAYLMQAADERVLAPHCVFMFHEGMEGHSHNHPKIIEKWMAYNKKFGVKLNQILLEKMRIKNPDLKEKKFNEMNLFDAIYDAQEAIDAGLADRLLRDGELSE
jgi:ATP-dependent Clp protease protease subunit